MKRLTFEGNFCDIATCSEVRGGTFCEDGACSQRKTWERLKAIEDILGDDYELDRLRDMVKAADLLGKTVYEPNKRGFISTYEIISVHISTCSVLVGWNLLDGIYSNLNGFEISALGKTVFLTRTEAALKAREQK